MGRTTSRFERQGALAVLLATAAVAGCGGGSDGAAVALTELAFTVAWEQPAAGSPRAAFGEGAAASFDTPIPPSVNAIRFTFRPAAPEPPCCIVIPRGSQPFTDRRLVLGRVAEGLGSLEVYGFPTFFAPANGVTATCATSPLGQGQPCGGDENTLASFGSDQVPVDVVRGERNVVEVDVYSLPFLVDLDPQDGATADGVRPHVEFTVVDANHSIDPSVNIRLRRPPVTVQAQVLESQECRDGDAELPDCSEGGALQVRGLRVTSRSPQDLPAGLAELRIRASNTAPTPRSMESNTGFLVPPPVTTTLETTTTTHGHTTTTSSTSTTLETTTTTIPVDTTTTTIDGGPPATFCLRFSVSNTVDLVGLAFDVGYGASGGDFDGSGDGVQCFTTLETGPDSTLATFNDDESAQRLSAAIISAETFSGPIPVADCFFLQVPPLDLGGLAIEVIEATDPDLGPANATVTVEEVPCPL